jgi:hypothetical protein
LKRPFCLLLILFLSPIVTLAQTAAVQPDAAKPIQVSAEPAGTSSPTERREIKIPAGTPLEIETAYTIDSQYVRPEDLISFRVLIPIKLDGVTVIEKYSLVTGRIVQAKRGGHWGKAGKLSWTMQDVVAVDLTRVPLQARNDLADAKNSVKGTSHGGEVATHMIVFGALMWPVAPLVLMHGFKRGENAILPEGKRFVVFVQKDTVVKATPGLTSKKTGAAI